MTNDFRLTIDDEPDPLEPFLDDLRDASEVSSFNALRWYSRHRDRIQGLGWSYIDHPTDPMLYHRKTHAQRGLILGAGGFRPRWR